MTNVRVDRLTLRLAQSPRRDGERLAAAVGAALASLGGISGSFSPDTMRVRLSDDGTGTEEALARRIAAEVLRAVSRAR